MPADIEAAIVKREDTVKITNWKIDKTWEKDATQG